MNSEHDPRVIVSSAAELDAATTAAHAGTIVVKGTINVTGTVLLSPGQRMTGSDGQAVLRFPAGSDGVRLSTDNELCGLRLETEPDRRAVYNDTSVETLGTLSLMHLTTIGQVQILAENRVHAGHVNVQNVDVVDADVVERDHVLGYGVVDVRQGAFTLWNRQYDDTAVITARLRGITAGREGAPVRGSGVFVSGAGWAAGEGPAGLPGVGSRPIGRTKVTVLETGEVHSDGRIPEGEAKIISGGVFVLHGADVELVVNDAPVNTYGPNDMVLDNWGEVATWRATAPITSHGPSGIGFVNFGTIDRLESTAPITTHGAGARGFNLYDGFIRHASFAAITTHGDGAIGVQISKPLTVLELNGDLTTSGGEGQSLVKGVQVPLKAVALSIKPGGQIDRFTSTGRIVSRGDDVVTVEIEGSIAHLEIAGGIAAEGARSDAVHIHGDVPGLDAIQLTAVDGRQRVAV